MTKSLAFESLYANGQTNVPDGSGELDRDLAQGAVGHSFPNINFDGPQNAKESEITYTAADLAIAVEEARKATSIEVERQTRKALIAEIDHRQAEALEAIRDQLGQSEEIIKKWVSETVSTTQSLAKIMGQAVVPKALELQPFADIADMIRQTLQRLLDEPSIELRLGTELVERTDELLGNIVEETGFSGEFLTVADPKISPGDARLVWKNGVADHCLERIQEEVNTMIDAWFADQPDDYTPARTMDDDTTLLAQSETMNDLAVNEHQSREERSTS